MAGGTPRRVIVVDDSEDTAQSFAALIETLGHVAAFTTDPRDALSLAERFRPDIAFIDLTMPHVDGFEVARLLRASAALAGVSLVAITAHGGPEERARSRQAGFEAHVQKPVDLRTVEAILEQMAR